LRAKGDVSALTADDADHADKEKINQFNLRDLRHLRLRAVKQSEPERLVSLNAFIYHHL